MKSAFPHSRLLSSIELIFGKLCLAGTKMIQRLRKRGLNRYNDDAKTVMLPCHKYYDNNSDVPKLEWINLLNRKVFLADNNELGRIEAVNADSIVIKRGSFRAKRYYIRPLMLIARNAKTTTNSHLSCYHEKYGNLFLDLVFDEVTLYKSNRIPNPNIFATLGTSYRYIPEPYSKWKVWQNEE